MQFKWKLRNKIHPMIRRMFFEWKVIAFEGTKILPKCILKIFHDGYNPFQKKKKGWVSSFASFKKLTVIKCFVKPFLCTMKHRMWVDCQTHVGSERMDAKRIFCFRQAWLEMMVIISKSSFMNGKLAIFFLF